MKCLQPQLTTLPEGLWICQPCADAGGTLAEAQRKQAQRQEALDRATLPNLYPDAAMKRRDQQAQQLHGRLIHKSWAEPGKSSRRWFWGRLHYRGPLSRPNYFVAVYEDSDYEIMSAATAKRFLKPAGTQLPAGISIPEVSQQLLQQLASTDLQEREAAAQNLQQQLTAAAAVMPLSVAVPSSADTKLLLSSLDLSRVAFTADPISSNHQLQAQLQQHGVQHMLRQPPFPAAIIIMAEQELDGYLRSVCDSHSADTNLQLAADLLLEDQKMLQQNRRTSKGRDFPATEDNGCDSSRSGSSSSSSAVKCQICLESFSLSSMMAATRPGLVGNIKLKLHRSQDQLFPAVHPQAASLLLRMADHWATIQQLELWGDGTCRDLCYSEVNRLAAEALVQPSLRVYCPFMDCSEPFLLDMTDAGPQAAGADDGQGSSSSSRQQPGEQQQPNECPYCHRAFCLACGTTGWHQNMTCHQFQALPPDRRSTDAVVLMRLAEQQGWQQCPGCSFLVERTQGCNYVHCRCGVGFCYVCGKRYKNDCPTASNAHGVPDCSCALFSYDRGQG
eukprot:gene5403-biopygen7207